MEEGRDLIAEAVELAARDRPGADLDFGEIGAPMGAPSRKVVFTDAGWSSSVARWAHNPEVAGSNPAPATKFRLGIYGFRA